MRTRDISQVFFSSEYDPLREVFIVPPKEANRPKVDLWRLLKPLYGLRESSFLWYAAFAGHPCSIFAMIFDPVDPYLFYRLPSLAPARSTGLLTMQVDDTLFTGISSFLSEEEAQTRRFLTKPYITISPVSVHFNDSFLSKTKHGLKASQTAYVDAITELETGTLSE